MDIFDFASSTSLLNVVSLIEASDVQVLLYFQKGYPKYVLFVLVMKFKSFLDRDYY